ncbi:MAG: hypothetical protein QOK37_3249 [Thermoanaerobaculia bacterium]|jgi:hypothetical protein|nr:hypothetical protein [Thermoanaerobaculia bacterium]
MMHFHNGDVAASLARRAGVPGRHVPFRESLVGGPVQPNLPLHEWVESRAAFLSEQYGEHLLRVRNDLLEQQNVIDRAHEEEEVVLWFEHDLFCLVHLLYLFSRLSKVRRLSLIWCPQPLGTQSEEDLFNLFQSRAAVTPAMNSAAKLAWSAFTSPDPTSLNLFLDANVAEFPFLRDGLLLHASRFPSTRNGLGEVERRAVEGIDAGAADFVSLFTRFDQSPPRFGFGDGEFLRHLKHLASAAVPVITIIGEEKANPPKALFALTPAGRNMMEATVDFVEINNPNFWLGGAHLTRERMWRWDAVQRQIVPSQPAVS